MPIEGRQAVRRSEVPPRSSLSRVGQTRALCRTIPSIPLHRGALREKFSGIRSRSSVLRPVVPSWLNHPLSREAPGQGPPDRRSLPQRAERSGVERSQSFFFFLLRFPTFLPFPNESREDAPEMTFCDPLYACNIIAHTPAGTRMRDRALDQCAFNNDSLYASPHAGKEDSMQYIESGGPHARTPPRARPRA